MCQQRIQDSAQQEYSKQPEKIQPDPELASYRPEGSATPPNLRLPIFSSDWDAVFLTIRQCTLRPRLLGQILPEIDRNKVQFYNFMTKNTQILFKITTFWRNSKAFKSDDSASNVYFEIDFNHENHVNRKENSPNV